MLTRFALPALAAAVALVATAPFVHEAATAQPAPPTARWVPPPDGGGSQLERLRAENAQLRAELGAYRTALADGLDRFDSIDRSSRDRRTVMRLRRAIDDLRADLAGGRDGWDDDDGTWGQPRDPRPSYPPRPDRPDPSYGAMSPTDFAQLQAQLANARFPTDQMNVLGAAAPRNRFTVDQVVALMQVFAFDDARIEVAVLLAPRVIDGNRFYLTLDALQFSSSKDALRQRVQF